MKAPVTTAFWVTILLAVLFIGFIVSASSSSTSSKNSNLQETSDFTNRYVAVKQGVSNTDRFILVEQGLSKAVDIVYDKNTLVMYAVSMGRYNEGCLTILCDSTGKPLLWKSNH